MSKINKNKIDNQNKGDILIIDDRIENLKFLSEMLTNNGYEVRQVLTGKQALKIIDYEPPELIFLDIMMPEMDGYEVCRQIKLNSKKPDIPIIFVSAKQQLSEKIKAFEIGGIDYITKPFLLAEVLCRVKVHLNNYRNQKILAKEVAIRKKAQQKLKIANQKLTRLVDMDGLTGIPNRGYFNKFFPQEWYRLQREKKPISLIMIDIDYFKKYNDTYGHLRGDQTLKIVATTITKLLHRPADFVARYGGEEFVVVLPNTNLQGAKQVCQNIKEQISQLAMPHSSSEVSDYITLSMGIDAMIPSADKFPEMLIDNADQALYQAKNQGRNCIAIKNGLPT